MKHWSEIDIEENWEEDNGAEWVICCVCGCEYDASQEFVCPNCLN